MKKNFLIKTLAIILILILVSANLSFAGTAASTNFKTSMEKMLNSNMTILGTGSRVTSSSMDEEEGTLIVDDSKISLNVKIGNLYKNFNFINYELNNGTYKFDFDMKGCKEYFDFSTQGETGMEELYPLLVLLFQAQLLQNCYLAVSETVGQDLSLAYTYFTQEVEKADTENEINIKNNVFEYKVEATEKNNNISIDSASLSVNSNNLKNLNKSMVDKSNYYYVIIGEETLSNCTISNISNKTYTGSNIKPSIKVKYNGIELEEGTDYKVTYSNNKNPGKATATIKGTGAFKGTIKKDFIITPKKVTGLKAKSQSTDYINLTWSKQTGVTGYEVYTYNSSKKEWKYVGKTSNNSYKIKKLKAGTEYKYKVKAYKTIDNKKYYGSYSSTLKTATKTKTPKISELTTKSKKATIKWKKVSGASGYQIYMSTSKNGKYSKIKTASKSSTSYTKTELKKNKKYYFKIRSYKTVDGKKIYSSYSSVKNIKVK